MKRRLLLMLCLVLPVGLIGSIGAGATRSGAAARYQPPADDSDLAWDKFQILVTRNIFVRDRSPRVRPDRGSRPSFNTSRADRDEDSLVLTGISHREDEWTAFFEDTRTGKTLLVQAGQPLGPGRILSVTLDAVDYQQGGASRRLSVGQALTGTARILYIATTRPMPTTSSQPGEVIEPPDSGTPAADPILERLRLRRLQEMGQ